MKLFLALIFFTQSVYGAAIWPNGNRLQTFQNGFLFGNGQTIDSAASGFNFGNGAQFNGPLTLQQQSTPASPSSGFDRLYFKSDENLYKLDSSSQEVNVSSVVGGGQQQSGASFPEIRVPNQQVVRTATGVGLIETGNSNLLLNSGFEHQTYNVGWTTSGTATYSAETSAPLSGLKSFRAVASAQTIDLLQDTTLYAAARAGSQMFISFEAKNTAAGVTACIRLNGVKQTGSNNCLTLATDGVIRSYELAFLANGTSNGIEIDAAPTTGTLIVDEVKISTQSAAFIDVAQIGPWIDYTPTFQGFGTPTTIDARYRIFGSSVQLNISFTIGTPTAVEARVGLPLNLVSDTGSPSNNTLVGIYARGVGSNPAIKRDTVLSQDATSYVTFASGEYAIAANPLVPLNGSSAFGTGERLSFFATVPVSGLSNKVSTYSQACTTDVQCENVFSARIDTSSGTPVIVSQSPTFIASLTDSSPGDTIINFVPGIFTVVPQVNVNQQLLGVTQILSPTTSDVRIVTRTGTGGGSDTLFDIQVTKQGADFKAKNVITGTFQNIEKCADPYECTDTFSARLSSGGVISEETPASWINGNASGTNPYIVTFDAGLITVAPQCWGIQVGTNNRIITVTSSTTTASFYAKDDSGTAVTADMNIFCRKQGVDFRPKTAVAGTFLDAVTAPNTGSIKTCYYKFGGASATLAAPTECTSGTCVEVEDSCGTASPPTQSSTGRYFNLTFADGTWANNTPLDCKCEGFDTSALNNNRCTLLFDTGDQTWSTNSNGGAVINMEMRDQGGGEKASYGSVRCEAKAR